MSKIDDQLFEGLSAAYHTEGVYRDGFPAEVLRIIRGHKLFKLFLPEKLGGAGLSLQQTLDVVRRCAYINGSLGWLVQIGNGGNYFAAYIGPETAAELFSPADAVLAGSGALTGTATPVEGGYRVSGRWKYASGSMYASFFTVSCTVTGSNEPISCVLFPEQVHVIDDWDTIGMRYTGTNTFTAENQFVPHTRVFGLYEMKWLHEVPVFSFPFLAFAQAFFLSVQYGLLERLKDEAIEMATANRGRWQMNYPQRADAIVVTAQRISDRLQLRASGLGDFISSAEQASGTERDKIIAELDASAKEQNTALMAEAQSLFSLLGMEALYEAHPANIAYRDMVTCAQHSLLNAYALKA